MGSTLNEVLSKLPKERIEEINEEYYRLLKELEEDNISKSRNENIGG